MPMDDDNGEWAYQLELEQRYFEEDIMQDHFGRTKCDWCKKFVSENKINYRLESKDWEYQEENYYELCEKCAEEYDVQSVKNILGGN